jgi:hypothetical protein
MATLQKGPLIKSGFPREIEQRAVFRQTSPEAFSCENTFAGLRPSGKATRLKFEYSLFAKRRPSPERIHLSANTVKPQKPHVFPLTHFATITWLRKIDGR